MKMRPEDYAQLEQAVNRVLSEQPDKTAQGYAAAGLSAMRFRWDALNMAVRWVTSRDWVVTMGRVVTMPASMMPCAV